MEIKFRLRNEKNETMRDGNCVNNTVAILCVNKLLCSKSIYSENGI